MARTLTVSRARVGAGGAAEYLGAVRELARLGEERGRHLWIFRSRTDPALFLECSESRGPDSHRAVVEQPEDERRLEDRVRALAQYEAGAWDLWEEA